MMRWQFLLSLAVVMAASELAGCRAEEQDRARSFQPGTYTGRGDEPLTAEQRETLRQRVELGH